MGQPQHIDQVVGLVAVERHPNAALERGVEVDLFTRCRGGQDHEVRELAPGIRVVSVKAGPCNPIPKADVPRFLPEFLGGVLRIAFPTGNVDVPAGTSVILGRDPAQSLVAAAFGQYDNVSRRHATVMVDDGGRATIRDEGSTNGTFVNGERVLPGNEVRLVDGDQIRLAADVTGDVSLPRGEPDPASLSRNGFV